MLLCKQRGRHEYRNLLAALHGGEAGSQCNFRLAESDITANDPIHRLVGGEILEDLPDRPFLVFGKVEREAGLEGPVFRFRPAETVPGSRRATGVNVEQLGGNVADPLYCPFPGPRPLVAPQAMKRCVFGRCARIPRDKVEGVDGNIELVAVRILEMQEFAFRPAGFECRQSEVTPEAVLGVDDRRSRLEVVQLANYRLGIALGQPSPPFLPWLVPEQLVLADDCEITVGQLCVEAAIEGNREKALQCLLLDPTITDINIAKKILDDYLTTYKEHLPQFWK